MAHNPRTNHNITVNTPSVGMKLSKSQSELTPGEFSLALNANLQTPVGNNLEVTNEQSSLLCVNFPTDYKVIGVLPINVLTKTIYFLVNPFTNQSEIGSVDNIFYSDTKDKSILCDTCNSFLTEDSPLETIKQTPLCTYTKIVNANCLNFNINNPISATYEIGVDVTTSLPDCNNTTIFFTDALNPRRFVNIDNYPKTILAYDTINCHIPIYSNDLDCSAIKVASEFKQPSIITSDIVSGGSLKGGVYQFAVAYSNVNSDPITDYSLITNPVSIFSTQKTITVPTDYLTDLAIKLQISNLDTEFQYFNIAVLQTINLTTTPFLIGMFSITSENFTYTYTGNEYNTNERLTLDEVVKKRPVYETAKYVSKAGDRLYWEVVNEQREINLQPAVNDLSLQFQTISTDEIFYKDPLSYNYVGYPRDEVVAFSIYFKKTNGFQTADFLISGKPASYYTSQYGVDVFATTPSGNINVLSSGECDPALRNQAWQLYDTSQIIHTCRATTSPSPETRTLPITNCPYDVDYYGVPNPSGDVVYFNGPCSQFEVDPVIIAKNLLNNPQQNLCLKSRFETYNNVQIINASYQIVDLGPAPDSQDCITIRHKFKIYFSYELSYTVPIAPPSGNIIIDDCSVNGNCNISLYQNGDFQYWQSSLTYPNNPDIWAELCGQPIRYHKFPSSCTIHIHDNPEFPTFATQNKIYPIGIKLDINDVKRILNNAVDKGLISEQEKLEFTSFGIKRSNRRSSKSIISRGIMYDVWKTPFLTGNQTIQQPPLNQYFSNFPYNDLHPNLYISTDSSNNTSISHPFSPSNQNDRYVFYGANTLFGQPFLGSEIKLETVEYGISRGQFIPVKNHSQYILLNQNAVNIAIALAGFEVGLEAAVEVGQAFAGAGSILSLAVALPLFLAAAIAEAGLVLGGNFFKYVQQWKEIFTKLGAYRNYTSYYASVGNYSNYCCISDKINTRFQANLTNSIYLTVGNSQFTENQEAIYFNNDRRESSVYLSIANSNDSILFNPPSSACSIIDDSRVLPNVYSVDTGGNTHYSLDLNTNFDRNVSSYYATIKNYVPDQYGTPDQIDWIDTGYYGEIDWNNPLQDISHSPIFGGDTYINKLALKREYPFFTQERVDSSLNSEIEYSKLGNVGFPKWYFDTIADTTRSGLANTLYPVPANLIGDNDGGLYYHGFAPLYMYGIPYFFCESDYNTDLRHAEDSLAKNFYPYIGDIYNWTQEFNVPIGTDNYFIYNQDYSKQNRENFSYVLKNSFKNDQVYCRAEYPNRVIYSPQGVQNWLDYLAADFYDFPKEDGLLIGLNEIEEDAVLVRQENSTKVFNAFITIGTSLADAQITTGNIFAAKPREYYKSDLGFGGSTHNSFVSTPFGHFYVDTQNPCIFQKLSDSLRDITRDAKDNTKIQWFAEFLPFQILKDFPTVDVDNAYKYFGISLCWDNRYDRLFITKRDAKLKPEFKNKVTYTNNLFYFNELPIEPTDERYFSNKSWTIAYSPIVHEWISFYSFSPNFYNSTENYFQTGLNYSTDKANLGLYSHNLTNKSYQVFNGILYPHIIEYSTKDTIINTTLDAIQYNHSVQRWQDNLSFFNLNDKTFSEVLVYTDNQSTGTLYLVPKQKNNQQQFLQYQGRDVLTKNGKYVLVDNVEYNWRVNDGLYDISLQNNQPLLTYQNKPYKEVNLDSLSYQPTFFKNKLRSDSFYIRFANSTYSQYRFITEFNLAQQTDSPI